KMSRNCRTCGKFIYSLTSKNLFQEPDSIMLHQIHALTGLFLLEGSEFEFPACICGPCEVALREAIRFRERVILTQKTLQSSPSVGMALQTIDLNEAGEDLPVKEAPTEDEVLQFDVIEEQVVEVFEEIPVEEEQAPESEKISPEQEEIQVMPDKVNPPKTPHTSMIFGDNCRTRQQPRIQWDKLTEEETVLLRRERRKRECICEQCGRHFSCPSNFKVHLLRHSGVKTFACDQCPQKFYTAHLLRRHQVMHTNEKPYPCNYCEMAFNNVSGRIQHERIRHTSIKPYKCSECEKCFAVSGKLRAHMLSHTGVRAFHCESCKVSFIRRSHLISHFRSKGHAQNVRSAQETVSKPLDLDV
ncbi:hypothetical protein KR009_012384, partial [Drosophila setifemur]